MGAFFLASKVDNRNNSPLEISHLLFVGDTPIMCDANMDLIIWTTFSCVSRLFRV